MIKYEEMILILFAKQLLLFSICHCFYSLNRNSHKKK